MKKMEEDMKRIIIDNVSVEDSDETPEYIDLYACYEPVFEPPLDFLEECRKRWAALTSPFCTTIERKIGNTRYIIETECARRELLTDKAKRLIFSEKGAVC